MRDAAAALVRQNLGQRVDHLLRCWVVGVGVWGVKKARDRDGGVHVSKSVKGKVVSMRVGILFHSQDKMSWSPFEPLDAHHTT